MPAAIAIPAIASVVAGVGGAALASHASGKASKANRTAQAEALAYEREKDAAARADRDKVLTLQANQWNAWNANRAALAKRYGVNVPQGKPMTLADIIGSSGGRPTARPVPLPGGGGGGTRSAMIMAALAAAGGGAAALASRPKMPELQNPNDFLPFENAGQQFAPPPAPVFPGDDQSYGW